MARCAFPARTVFDIELEERHWHVARKCVNATKAIAEKYVGRLIRAA